MRKPPVKQEGSWRLWGCFEGCSVENKPDILSDIMAPGSPAQRKQASEKNISVFMKGAIYVLLYIFSIKGPTVHNIMDGWREHDSF